MRFTINSVSNILLSLLSLIAVSGCIHTYPNGDGVDPTLVKVGVEISMDINWETQNVIFTKSANNNYRLIVEFFRNNESTGRYERYLTKEEFADGKIKLIMPFDFHAVNYKVTAWLDIVETDKQSEPIYDITGLSSIRRIDNHISWSDNNVCAFCSTDISLQNYKDKWGAKVMIPLTLIPPIGRFKIIAEDMTEFRQYIANAVEHGETYSICLAFERRLPSVFNAPENTVTDYLEFPEYYFSFPLTGSEIASGAIFLDDTELQLAAKVMIFNSARVIISKSPSIEFPIERGKVTVISGDILTDYYTNNINVNNIWDGEIIIEI